MNGEQNLPQEKNEDVIHEVNEPLYVGIDVGGTKIQSCLIGASGRVFSRWKGVTPRGCPPEETVNEIERSVYYLLEKESISLDQLLAVGIAIPGVVETETGNIIVTPNMNLSGVKLGEILQERFHIPVAVGNDGNLGTLGEAWLGSGRNAKSVVGIFVGTGVGSGIVVNGNLWTGAAHAAGEIGHMVVQVPVESWKTRIPIYTKKTGNKSSEKISGKSELSKKPAQARLQVMEDNSGHSLYAATGPFGPEIPVACGCGNYGCLESLASRTAIEREIRLALAHGAESIITELTGGDMSLIRSGVLSKALKRGDAVVSAIVHYNAEVLAYACLTIRHFFDPEVIILGGGVMEACHHFIMPVIEKIMENDKLPAAASSRRILLSSLGDDAVALGAVALAQIVLGRGPFSAEKYVFPEYPRISQNEQNEICVNDVVFRNDFYIMANGKICSRGKLPKKDPHGFRRKDIEFVCEGPVQLLVLATDQAAEVSLSKKSIEFLVRRGIEFRILPVEEAISCFNTAEVHRAAVFHL
ncbi:MAG: ROK family protein [Planctomycetia bacterium]|nr:ROK family protein [Planctomycetia bacterium]